MCHGKTPGHQNVSPKHPLVTKMCNRTHPWSPKYLFGSPKNLFGHKMSHQNPLFWSQTPFFLSPNPPRSQPPSRPLTASLTFFCSRPECPFFFNFGAISAKKQEGNRASVRTAALPLGPVAPHAHAGAFWVEKDPKTNKFLLEETRNSAEGAVFHTLRLKW